MSKTGLLLLLGLLGTLFLGRVAGAYEVPQLDATLHGFLDARYGLRLQDDPYERDTSLAETRLQLSLTRMGEMSTLQLRADIYADDLVAQDDLDLEEGRGWLDLREANLLVSPTYSTDIKVGRQILTWGTGDLLFLNDLFPKDWQSFFSGRDVEYLKAPSDAVMVSLFPPWFNIDLVYTPRFDADRYIRGERLSYWNPQLGRTAGRDAVVAVARPDDWFSDDEWALRLSKNLAGYELALYGYSGFWKSPGGFDPASGRATFPKLSVYGASLRGVLGSGIGNLELGYYDSRADRSGNDPLIPNSELRLLLGYEQELVSNLTLAGQYYLEVLQDYAHYEENLPPGQPARDQYRQLLTLRLTWLLLNQNLTASMFGYLSPSDADYYLRPTISYKLTDEWLLTAGANLFGGDELHTFFSQFSDNTNIYAGLRYSF
jgi:hypothetical protein